MICICVDLGECVGEHKGPRRPEHPLYRPIEVSEEDAAELIAELLHLVPMATRRVLIEKYCGKETI